jgi:SAM-dependent methyltransferase
MDDDVRRQARSFGPVADAYHRGRPSFPVEAVRWLVGEQPATVLELGAGTGKMTAVLAELGHDVHATEPDPAMLAVLQRHLPDVPTSESGAEEIPLPDRSVDVVVAAHSFHWFDHDVALPEIARVLRPRGHLALTWNNRDTKIPWVRKLGRILDDQPQAKQATSASVDALVQSDLFGFVEDKQFPFWQDVNRESIVDLVASRSYVSTLDEEAREAKLAQVLALYDDYGRGMDGMQLLYACECFRAQVVDRPDQPPSDSAGDTDDEAERPGDAGPGDDGPGDGRRVSDGGDTDMLLIDFR